MDKVIELLNVYRKEKYPKSKLRYYKYDSLNHEFLSNCIPNDSEEKVLGRRFGFIKWLVDNDKIDRTYREDLKYPYYIDDKERDLKGYEKSDLLVMLCSIQDNPIEFLCSVLK